MSFEVKWVEREALTPTAFGICPVPHDSGSPVVPLDLLLHIWLAETAACDGNYCL